MSFQQQYNNPTDLMAAVTAFISECSSAPAAGIQASEVLPVQLSSLSVADENTPTTTR